MIHDTIYYKRLAEIMNSETDFVTVIAFLRHLMVL